MKRLISLILCLAVLAGLAACNKISADEKAPEYSEEVYTHEFTDSQGNVAAKLEYHYPLFEKNADEAVASEIKSYFEKDIAIISADLEKNTDNISDYIKRFNLKGPELTIVTFEEYFVDSTVASFIFTTKKATDIDDAEGTQEGVSFTMVDGSRLSIEMLSLVTSYDTLEKKVKQAIIDQANLTYSPNAVMLDDAKIELFNSCYDSDNFITDGINIIFLYSNSTLSQGSRSGTYRCEIDMSSIDKYVQVPYMYEETEE